MKARLFFPYYGVRGILYVPFLIMFFYYVVYSLYLLFSRINQFDSVKRNQALFIGFGTLIASLGGGTNYLLWFDIPVPPYGNVLVPVYVILIAYAIIKYRLMDIRLVISNTAIFIGVYSLVLGLPFYIYSLGTHLIALIIMLVLATTGLSSIYIYRRGQRIVYYKNNAVIKPPYVRHQLGWEKLRI